jgi:glycosyltransferase involved in cell wall biosynthesis
VVAFDLTPTQNAHRNRGIGRYVAGLAMRLARQSEVPIEFLGWSYARPFEPPPPHRAIWLPRYAIPRSRAPWVFAKLALRLMARRSQAPVVHITDPRALSMIPGRTIVTTAYDLIPLAEPGANRGLMERAGYRGYLRSLRRVERVFAISKQTGTDLVERLGLPASRVVIAPAGVDARPSAWAPSREATPYFLYLGTAERHKNLTTLVRALHEAGTIPERLVIAGTWYPEQVRALSQEAVAYPGMASRLDFRGFVPEPDLAGMIAGATAVVVPSRREGFGLPVAEGLAGNGVVIHSRIPVLLEVSDGAALTFDPDSSAELADALRRVSQDTALRDDLRQRGRRRSAALTWDAALAATLGVYRELLARQPNR